VLSVVKTLLLNWVGSDDLASFLLFSWFRIFPGFGLFH
jgi:hypothetical protein